MIEFKHSFRPVILDRGYDLYNDGRIGVIRKLNNTYTARVSGSSEYKTTVKIDGNTFIEGSCTCPYKGLCKHTAGLLFAISANSPIIDENKEQVYAFIKNSDRELLDKIILDELDNNVDFYIKIMNAKDKLYLSLNERIDKALSNKEYWDDENNQEEYSEDCLRLVVEEIRDLDINKQVDSLMYLIERINYSINHYYYNTIDDLMFESIESLFNIYMKISDSRIIDFIIGLINQVECHEYLCDSIIDAYIDDPDFRFNLIDKINNNGVYVTDKLIDNLSNDMDKASKQELKRINKKNGRALKRI